MLNGRGLDKWIYRVIIMIAFPDIEAQAAWSAHMLQICRVGWLGYNVPPLPLPSGDETAYGRGVWAICGTGLRTNSTGGSGMSSNKDGYLPCRSGVPHAVLHSSRRTTIEEGWLGG